MIHYIKGIVEEVGDGYVVLDNGGIGYRLFVPGNIEARLPGIGKETKLYTHFHVREDLMQLFGFLTKEDLEMFRLLISVSGIGPKGAIGVLSVISTQDLKFAILADDAKTIAKAPGIGKKTAEKTVLELKDKVSLEDAFEEKLRETENQEQQEEQGIRQDAVEALTALGYSQTEAWKAVRAVTITPDMQVEQVLKLGLKNISTL